MEETKVIDEKEIPQSNNNDNKSPIIKSITKKGMAKLVEPFLKDILLSEKTSSRLRDRKKVNYCDDFPDEQEEEKESKKKKIKNDKRNESFNDESFSKDSSDSKEYIKLNKVLNKKRAKKKNKKHINKKKSKVKVKSKRAGSFSISQIENEYSNEYIELTTNTQTKNETKEIINQANVLIQKLEKEFLQNELNPQKQKSIYPDYCIPINADVLTFKFDSLVKKQLELTNKLFDVIMMDPPWQLSSSHPTRGVAIAYTTLNDNTISKMPIETLQKDGFIFIWTINAKLHFALELMKHWGYKYCDEIVWVKQTVNGKIAKGHGYYLQHTKETCLVGIKGNPKYTKNNNNFDVIFSQRRGQSQKPTEIYERIEKLIPNGHYLEIFGRRNNLRNYWVTIGNEI